MNNKIFKLSPRLNSCAQMVRKGSKIADIGTDHAYLPIIMAKLGIISHAIAADLRIGPINNAKKNIEKYKVENIVEVKLSNGLQQILSTQVDDIIIAGMGGKEISKIIKDANWLKDSNKSLILQPMTSVKELRMFLLKEGFEIVKEQVVLSENKLYTVIKAVYSETPIKIDDLYEYIGKININENPLNVKKYIKREIKNLKNKQKGFLIKNNIEKFNEISTIIGKLQNVLNKRT